MRLGSSSSRPISAGARGVGLFAAGRPGGGRTSGRLLTRGDALVQPFEPSVSAGERSLMYLRRAVSPMPSARSRPTATSGCRPDTAARYLPHEATPAELAAAQAALDCVSMPTCSTRGSIWSARHESPLVMELELIEPEIFLPMADGAAGRLAADSVAYSRADSGHRVAQLPRGQTRLEPGDRELTSRNEKRPRPVITGRGRTSSASTMLVEVAGIEPASNVAS